MTESAIERQLLSTMEMPAVTDSAEFLIRSKIEILRVLTDIMQQRVPVSVNFIGGSKAIASAVVEMDESANSLYLACPREWQSIIDTPGNSSVMLVCAYDDAKLQFQGEQASVVHFGGRTVARLELPTFLWRFQRRRDTRYKAAPSLKIELNLGFLESTAEIADLSLGGVGVINCDADVNLHIGETLRGCAMMLPGVGRISVDLQVQYCAPLRMSDGSSMMRIGCQFAGLRESERQLIAHYLKALAQT